MTYPILLCHGFCRFDIMIPTDNDDRLDRFHYWRNIRTHLQSEGFEVHHLKVQWAGPVHERARQLADQVRAYLADRTDVDKVNLVAHSMGGLDSRYALAKYDIGPQVASLTTIATPHHGTSLADLAANMTLSGPVMASLKKLGIDITGLHDLTTAACEGRNIDLAEYEDANPHQILYQAYAAAQATNQISLPLLPTHYFLLQKEGPNDGLVSEASSRWDDRYYRATVDLDHINQLGWGDEGRWNLLGLGANGFQTRVHDFYLEVARELP